MFSNPEGEILWFWRDHVFSDERSRSALYMLKVPFLAQIREPEGSEFPSFGVIVIVVVDSHERDSNICARGDFDAV